MIELLIVITIIGILASIALVSYGGAQARSRDSKRKQDLDAIKKALELAKLNSPNAYYYPMCNLTSCQGSNPAQRLLDSSTTPALAPTYIKAVPKDPKTNEGYRYNPYDPTNTSGNPCTQDPTSGNVCTAYDLYTCLENANDPQKSTDSAQNNWCGTQTGFAKAFYIISSE